MQQYRIEIKWSIIIVVMTLIWMWGEKLVGLHDVYIDQHPTYTNLIAIPYVILYVLAMLDKRTHHFQGKLTYKQGFISGLIITGIVTLFVPVSQSITSLIITPEYFNNVTQYVVEKGIMSSEEAADQFNLGSYIVQGVIGAPIIGAITSAAVALFIRRS